MMQFAPELVPDAAKVRQALAFVRALRSSDAPGRQVAEERLMEELSYLAGKCGKFLEDDGWPRLTGFDMATAAPVELQPVLGVLRELHDFALACFQFKRPRDFFGGTRRALAFEILGRVGLAVDLPEVVGMARQALKKTQSVEARQAAEFLQVYFGERGLSPDDEMVEELLSLTGLKKWFERPERHAAFALWVAARANSRKGKTAGAAGELFKEGRRFLAKVNPYAPQVDRDAAQCLHERLRDFQNEYQHQQWGLVRIIHNWNLMLVEQGLEVFLWHTDSPAHGNKLVADYFQHYNSRCGSGLSGPSRTKIEEMVGFMYTFEALEGEQQCGRFKFTAAALATQPWKSCGGWYQCLRRPTWSCGWPRRAGKWTG
jgi:hypothetical protein